MRYLPYCVATGESKCTCISMYMDRFLLSVRTSVKIYLKLTELRPRLVHLSKMLLPSINVILVGVLASANLANAAPILDDRAHFVLHERSATKNGRWGVHCFGTKNGFLNHKGTDAAVMDLKQYTGKGRTIKTSNTNGWKSFFHDGAKAYICTDHKHDSQTWTAVEVGAALGAMDSVCERYEASYALWFDKIDTNKYRSTSKIVGKDFTNNKICQNSQGGAVVTWSN